MIRKVLIVLLLLEIAACLLVYCWGMPAPSLPSPSEGAESVSSDDSSGYVIELPDESSSEPESTPPPSRIFGRVVRRRFLPRPGLCGRGA